MIPTIISIVLLILAGIAFIKKSSKLRMIVIAILAVAPMIREFGMYRYIRSIPWSRPTDGLMTDQFREGAHFILDSFGNTGYVIYVSSLLIIILCIKEIMQTK